MCPPFVRVATGLDSLILGEYQIVSQLKEAFSWVDNTALVGPELTRMVHKAFEAGKLVRTKTALNKGAVSVSSAAVELASNKLGDFPNIKAFNCRCRRNRNHCSAKLVEKRMHQQLDYQPHIR